ncbi:Glutaminase [Candidatus Sulfopaludibacter sp. SbA6]|nr:Glutaminase [Candidatus Sulfopaludibacter sp. SbA6]
MTLFALVLLAPSLAAQPLRPPAVPLVAHDPYFSIWSMTDRLTDSGTAHWTGKPNSLAALARIDGKTYRVMGRDRQPSPALDQTRLEVLPTSTIYEFSGSGIALTLTFFTPALPEDLDVLSRPLTYIDWRISATDGREHEAALYFEAASDLVVNTTDQPVLSSRYRLDGQPVLRMGSRDQPILAKRGDDLRIDWGYLYLAADKPDGVSEAVSLRQQARSAFDNTGHLPDSDNFAEAGAAPRGAVNVLAFSIAFGRVGPHPVSRYLMIAYDDLYSIEYFERRERPWWRRKGADAAELLRAARRDHDSLLQRSQAFDAELMADLTKTGGERYARLAALAYRQTLAAHKLVADIDGTPMYFPKENFSNGCISTVDVIYPSSPFTLLFNPKLLRAQLQPVLEYARMERWRWPFAPHDLGTYPQANGQVYGGGERTEENQMPVEESGNMLIMLAALARVEGSAAYSEKYWPELTRWAEYLKEKGLDPENQLSTDDFAGHLAHNANLSIKAILALGSYGMLAEMIGRKQDAALYRQTAQEFARKWLDLANDGDHYRLAFDKPGTWSQKYNLVWDKLLGLNLFPPDVARKEMAFYLTKQNAYGLPLDNLKDYTKLDWVLWTATLADNTADFEKLVAPAFQFANTSVSRVPLTDWYDTVTGKQQGFQARSVVGGLFVKMLADPAVWKKYAGRGVGR